MRARRFDAPKARCVVRERGLSIPTSDGLTLLADQWFPTDVTPTGTLLVRSPYGRGVIGFAYGRTLAHAGFRVIVVSSRGTAGSGGDFEEPWVHEAADAQDVVRWMREQPWFSGTFATIGASYVGYTQAALAMDPPPELVGMVLQIAMHRTSRWAWHNGCFAYEDVVPWAGNVSRDPEMNLKWFRREPQLLKAFTRHAGDAPLLRSYRAVTERSVPWVEQVMAHPAPDEFWKDYDTDAALERISVPVLVQGGWYDVFVADSIEQYRALRARDVPVQLTMGAYSHGTFSNNVAEHLREATQLLESVFAGEQAIRATPVRANLLGARVETWMDLAEWPPPIADLDYYLDEGSRLNLTDPVEGSTSFIYDPSDPTPSFGGTILGKGAGAVDNRAREARSDVICFTSEPMTTDVIVAGSAQVDLHFETSAPATGLFVRLCDVGPDGTSLNRSEEITAVDGARPGVLTLDLLPSFFVLKTGHRLRLQISSSAHPHYLRHTNTAEPVATATLGAPAQQTVRFGPAAGSRVRLPVMT